MQEYPLVKPIDHRPSADLILRHREHWLQRNRPQGLGSSTKWLETIENCYGTAG
jgi:hypothetical protein